MGSQRVAYVNGKIVPESEAGVSINDLGFLYGDAVFDTTRTFDHVLFRFDDHLDRLYSLAEVHAHRPRRRQGRDGRPDDAGAERQPSAAGR